MPTFLTARRFVVRTLVSFTVLLQKPWILALIVAKDHQWGSWYWWSLSKAAKEWKLVTLGWATCSSQGKPPAFWFLLSNLIFSTDRTTATFRPFVSVPL